MMQSGSESTAVARRMLALGLWTAIGAVAVVLVGRSASGELDVTITPWMGCAAATVVAGLSLYAWWQDHRGRTDDEPFACAMRGMTALAAPGVISLVLVQESAAGLTYLLALGVIAVVGVCDCAFISRGRSSGTAASTPVRAPELHAESAGAPPGAPLARSTEVAEATATASPLDDPELSQSLTRRQADGGDCLEALLRVRFDPGQREVALHVPIWPSMSAIPEVECESLDSSDVELRVTSAHTYGVRIEARRPADRMQTDEEAAIGVLISAPVSETVPDEPSVIRPPLSA